MWDLSRNIYRFKPALVNEILNQHTVDEVRGESNAAHVQRTSLNAHLNTTRWYYVLIQNMQSWET